MTLKVLFDFYSKKKFKSKVYIDSIYHVIFLEQQYSILKMVQKKNTISGARERFR